MRTLPVDYEVRNLGRSPVRLALSLVGSALVVLLAIAAAAFVRGMGHSLVSSGSERNVILLGAGSEESVERPVERRVQRATVERLLPEQANAPAGAVEWTDNTKGSQP